MSSEEHIFEKAFRLAGENKRSAAISTVAGAGVVFFLEAAKYLPLARFGQYACTAICIISAITAGVGYWRDARAAKARSAKAVRGLLPFIEADQELFKSLGCSVVIDKLVNLASDNQYPLMVLIGDPLAGKTSVLRAGLIPILPPDKVYYWQAKPEATLAQFEENIRVHFGVPLDELLSKTKEPDKKSDDDKPATDIRPSVIIIDHFDFLRFGHPSHDPFFDKFENLCGKLVSYRLKFLFCFRKEYIPVWKLILRKIKPENALKVDMSGLTQKAAEASMRMLLERANIMVDTAVIRTYIAQFSVEEKVLPFAIGLGTAVFGKWKQTRIRLKDYFRAGGYKGVIADYLEQPLHSFDPDQRYATFVILYRTMVDHETGTRKLNGFSQNDLMTAPGPFLDDIQIQALSGTDTRIIERVDTRPGETAYRLTHECLVDVLELLAQQTSTESARLTWSVTEQLSSWKKSQKTIEKLRSFLKNEQLNKALHAGSLLNPQDDFEQKQRQEYIRSSQKLRGWRRGGVFVTVLLIGLGLYSLYNWSSNLAQEKKLAGWYLPPELYKKQASLESLSIESFALADVEWLRPNRLSELEINSTVLNSLKGIENVHPKTLILNLTHSPIQHLSQISKMVQLTKLTLFLGDSGVKTLEDLRSLGQLETLSVLLDDSDINFSAIANLPKLRFLTLNLKHSHGQTLASLAKLSNIKELNLNLDNSSITELSDLASLTQLTKLRLSLKSSSIQRLGAVGDLHSLTALHIDLRGSKRVLELPDLSELRNLDCLEIDLTSTGAKVLPQGITNLTNLKTLVLRLTGTEIRELPDLNVLTKLENVSIEIDRLDAQSQLPFGTAPQSKRQPYRGLKSLDLDSRSFRTSDIKKLKQLPFLYRFDVDLRSLSTGDLPDFRQIRELQELTLHLYWSQIQSLPPLPSLTNLSLWIGEDAAAGSSVPIEKSGLDKLLRDANPAYLELHLDDSLIRTLPNFAENNRIDTFILYANRSKLRDWGNLSHLKQLTKLTLELEDCGIEKLPDAKILSQLTELKLKLARSGISNLDSLTATQMQILRLELGESKVKTLPDLSFMEKIDIRVSLKGGSLLPLSETRKLVTVREIMLDSTFGSIADLPPSVVKLNFGVSEAPEKTESCPNQ
jgi:hypothetical protein